MSHELSVCGKRIGVLWNDHVMNEFPITPFNTPYLSFAFLMGILRRCAVSYLLVYRINNSAYAMAILYENHEQEDYLLMPSTEEWLLESRRTFHVEPDACWQKEGF